MAPRPIACQAHSQSTIEPRSEIRFFWRQQPSRPVLELRSGAYLREAPGGSGSDAEAIAQATDLRRVPSLAARGPDARRRRPWRAFGEVRGRDDSSSLPRPIVRRAVQPRLRPGARAGKTITVGGEVRLVELAAYWRTRKAPNRLGSFNRGYTRRMNGRSAVGSTSAMAPLGMALVISRSKPEIIVNSASAAP